MKKHFVKFMSAGSFVAEETIQEIESWNVEKAIDMSKAIVERYSSKPYGFQFITKERTDADIDSKVTETSGIYYINGTVETLEEIKAKNNTDNRILISNMVNNGWNKVVTTRNPYRWTRPFNKNDSVVTVN